MYELIRLSKAVTNTHRTKEADRLVMDGLFTTNCIMPPRESYQDRVYTTSVVGYEGLKYIERKKDGTKDFSPLIEQALKHGGYEHDHSMSGIKKMYLGPTLPAFLSEGVVKILVDQYDLRPITAPE